MHESRDILARELSLLSPESKSSFYGWIVTLTMESDNEDGPGPDGFAEWLRHHETVPGDVTYVFYDGPCLLGTASLVKLDRDVAAPEHGWVIAGVNVVREHRGRGLGQAFMRCLEDELYRRARTQGWPLLVLINPKDERAIRLYTKFGCQQDPKNPKLYQKTYTP